jgi:predicted deacylase
MKRLLIAFVTLAVVGGGIMYYMSQDRADSRKPEKSNTEPYEVIGVSAEGRGLQAYRFGAGGKVLMYIGAIHGGYEWNTALLSYELVDYLTANPSVIPPDIQVIVIPVANPDGLYKVVGTSERFAAADAPQFEMAGDVSPESTAVSGRFNAVHVDLNRNFDCKWQKDALWGSRTVDAGTAAFSEPESRAIRDFILTEKPVAVIFFHSEGNGVYGSSCEGDILPGAVELLETYSAASDYPRYDAYTNYEVTGAAEDWLASQGIPSVTVELSKHNVIEWEKNRAGIKAMFELYSEAN